jgi:hypothetical protein
MMKISVFEDKRFKLGPSRGCPVLVLQQANGAFAGLLRLMAKNDHIDENTSLEQMAISTGSAKASELRKSLEWEVFDSGANRHMLRLKINT